MVSMYTLYHVQTEIQIFKYLGILCNCMVINLLPKFQWPPNRDGIRTPNNTIFPFPHPPQNLQNIAILTILKPFSTFQWHTKNIATPFINSHLHGTEVRWWKIWRLLPKEPNFGPRKAPSAFDFPRGGFFRVSWRKKFKTSDHEVGHSFGKSKLMPNPFFEWFPGKIVKCLDWP